MSFKVGYPSKRITNIIGGDSNGAFLKFITLAAGNTEFSLPAGVFLERISVSDPSNPPDPVVFTDVTGNVELASMVIEDQYAVDQLDLFIPAANNYRVDGLTATAIVSLRYYAHPNF